MKRCTWCRKKTLVTIECSCKNHYCVYCRHQEKHKCPNIEADREWERVKLNKKLKDNATLDSKMEKVLS